jgi:signal transduction histidine kinase
MGRPLVGITAVLLFVGATGLVTVSLAISSVLSIERKIGPLVQANHAVLSDLVVAESSIRGFALTGEPDALSGYEKSILSLSRNQAELESLTADDAELTELVEALRGAAQDWFYEYSFPIVRSGGGIDGYQTGEFTLGEEEFLAIRTASDAIDRRIAELEFEAQHEAANTLQAMLVSLLAVVVLGVAIAVVMGRRLSRGLIPPLVGLESTVIRLAEGDLSARAEETGPTEIRRVASAINELAAENERARQVEVQIHEGVQDLDRAKSEFVSNVSHEFRTPLTTIIGYTELLEDELEGADTESSMLLVIRRNAERMRALVEDLLALSSAESAGQTDDLIDLRRIVTDVSVDMRQQAESRGIEMHTDLPPDPVVVRGDDSQLSRMLLNLVTNAVKFSHDGGDVVVRVNTSGQRAVIHVEDKGIGIPGDQLTMVGSRFFRASNAVASEIAGTGLGLRIVRSIVDRHRGSMDVWSTEGQGTTITVRLPLVSAAAE